MSRETEIAVLSNAEKGYLSDWEEGGQNPSMSKIVATKLYSLYLQGHTFLEIVETNENKYPVGMVIEAAVRDKWYSRREEYLESLYASIAERAKQAQLQSVAFVSDMLAATAKLHGEKVKRYLQNGDISEMKDFPIGTVNSYRVMVEMLLKLTGQDKDTGTKVNIVTSGNSTVGVDGGTKKEIGMNSDVADKILALLEEGSG